MFEKELFGCTFNIVVLAVCVAATASDVMVAVGGLYSDDDADDDDDNTNYNNVSTLFTVIVMLIMSLLDLFLSLMLMISI